MLMVIFGAGASYDSVASRRPGAFDHESRLPLANQLFGDRPLFARVLTHFPAVQPLISRLRYLGKEQSLERELQAIRAEADTYAERTRQLVAVRYYLHMLIHECEQSWASVINGAGGETNYRTLLDEIAYCSPHDVVHLVTFNYDRLIEAALPTVNVRIQNLDDYVKGRFQLIKLHGSTNWSRAVKTPLKTAGVNGMDVIQQVIDARTLNVSNEFMFFDQHVTGVHGETPLFPALAIPFEEKLDFECPSNHMDALRGSLGLIDKILVIGWRATEQPFLQMLRKGLPGPVRCLVVTEDCTRSQETIDRMKAAGIAGDFNAVGGGFSELVLLHLARDFLRGEV